MQHECQAVETQVAVSEATSCVAQSAAASLIAVTCHAPLAYQTDRDSGGDYHLASRALVQLHGERGGSRALRTVAARQHPGSIALTNLHADVRGPLGMPPPPPRSLPCDTAWAQQFFAIATPLYRHFGDSAESLRTAPACLSISPCRSSGIFGADGCPSRATLGYQPPTDLSRPLQLCSSRQRQMPDRLTAVQYSRPHNWLSSSCIIPYYGHKQHVSPTPEHPEVPLPMALSQQCSSASPGPASIHPCSKPSPLTACLQQRHTTLSNMCKQWQQSTLQELE